MEPKRFCRRSRQEDMPDEAALAQNIRELVELLAPEKRASGEETARRLAHCRRCDQLQNGLCRLCGCYVELRAAKRHMGCPHVPDLWKPSCTKGENLP